jgi:hypothetical protein
MFTDALLLNIARRDRAVVGRYGDRRDRLTVLARAAVRRDWGT